MLGDDVDNAASVVAQETQTPKVELDEVTGTPMLADTPADAAARRMNAALGPKARQSAEQLLAGLVTVEECCNYLTALVEEYRQRKGRQAAFERTLAHVVEVGDNFDFHLMHDAQYARDMLSSPDFWRVQDKVQVELRGHRQR